MSEEKTGAVAEQVPPPSDPPMPPTGGSGGAAGDGDPQRRRHSAGGMSFGDKVRLVLRGVGQTLITFGLIILLFVVYEVYVTNWFASAEQAKVHTALEQEWKQGKDPLLPLPDGALASLPLGTGIANIYIPRLGRDYAWTIVQGSTTPTDAQLEQGPAHYGNTALPGQVGNFAVAGHRVGKGEPFLNLDKLRVGDAVIIETKSEWYVYRVKGRDHNSLTAKDADGIAGREIVTPDNTTVTLPVPDHPGAKPTEALMTMTTCTPKFTADFRMIVFSVLSAKLPRTSNQKPPAIVALYAQAGS
ncbi:MAG: class E sortase [Jatrophihabitantaceae bacterium]